MESRRIAESVIGSIDATGILGIQLDENVNNDFLKIKSELEAALQSEKTDVGLIQECINKYNEHALEIWNDYLTNVEDGKENDFRYLIHNCSKGEIKEDFRTKALSSSLITNKTMGVFGSKSKYGLILLESKPAVFILIAMSYALLPDVIILETLFRLSKLISQIQETSNPSARLSFSTNNNSFSSSSSFRILKLTLQPVGFLAKFIIVGILLILTSSSLPLFKTNFDKAFWIAAVSISYKLTADITATKL